MNPSANPDLKNLVDSLLNKLQNNPAALGEIIEELRLLTDEHGPVKPQDEPSQFNSWGRVFLELYAKGWQSFAPKLCLSWYNRLVELQVQNQRQYHKGGASHNAGVSFSNAGNSQSGTWFQACAFVDDTVKKSDLATPSNTPGTANLHLHNNWGLNDFEAIAAAARKVKEEGGNLWWFPETTLVHVARNGKLRIPPSETGIPINRPFLRFLLNGLDVGTADDKKKSLEFVASYLSITLPGVRIAPNAKAFEYQGAFEHEIDLVATQSGSLPTYLLDALGRHFLIECKNWETRVGTRDLNHFVAKMRFHRCNCGVIFSKEGLSGDAKREKGLQNARITQLRWYQQDSCVVIVVTKQDLEDLAASDSLTFADLLLRLYEAVRFSTSPEP